MAKTGFYTYYNRPPKQNTVLDYETKFVSQAEADTCGLKYQLERYGMDGLQQRFEAMKDKFGYADTRLVPSFAELQNRIVKGTNYFNELPSEIRAKFGHSPANYFDFIENHPDEAIKEGYISGEFGDYIKNKYGEFKTVLEQSDVTKQVETVEKTAEVTEVKEGEK